MREKHSFDLLWSLFLHQIHILILFSDVAAVLACFTSLEAQKPDSPLFAKIRLILHEISKLEPISLGS